MPEATPRSLARAWRGPVLALALVLHSGPSVADGTDLVFAPGQIAGLEPGQVLHYAHLRRGPDGTDAGPAEDGRITLTLKAQANGRAAILTLTRADAERRELAPFPGGDRAGNPLLLFFLETVSRRVAAATGGSPFYIRNRLRDAFRNGGQVGPAPGAEGARRVTYRPFEADPNAGRLGAFAELELRFALGNEVPGHFLALTAATPGDPPAYRESIRLTADPAPETGDQP